MRRMIATIVVGALALGVPSLAAAQTAEIQKHVEEKLDKLRLDDLINQALKGNPDIRVAESKVREADAELSRTRMKVVSDVTFLHAEIQAAKTMVDYAQKQHDRMANLRKSGTISEEAYREAGLALEKAKAELAGKQAKLPYLLGQSSGKSTTTLLDEMIKKKYFEQAKDTKITDEEFLRRVTLDLLGRLPTVEEMKKHLDAKDADRRIKWLDQLTRTHASTNVRLWDMSGACIRCHQTSPWSATDSYHGASVLDQWMRAIATRPESPMTEKLRQALDTKLKAEFRQVPLKDVMDFVRKNMPGVNLLVRVKSPFTPQADPRKLTADFSEPIPLGALLQYVEDELGCVFILRDYGVVVVGADEKLPPGAARVSDFWKHGRAIETPKSDPKTSEKDPNSPAKDVKGTIQKVDATDKTLVAISIGSDMGLDVGHKLDVYRTEPQPKFVGTLRIVSVTAQNSVGRMVDRFKETVRTGDKVAAQITPNSRN